MAMEETSSRPAFRKSTFSTLGHLTKIYNFVIVGADQYDVIIILSDEHGGAGWQRGSQEFQVKPRFV